MARMYRIARTPLVLVPAMVLYIHLIVETECEQHIAGVAGKLRIPGIKIKHAVDGDDPGLIDCAAAPSCPVHGLEIPDRIETPDFCAGINVKCTHFAAL